MNERLQVIGRLLQGEKMAELCREFGTSRKTVYKFWDRYQKVLFPLQVNPHDYVLATSRGKRTRSSLKWPPALPMSEQRKGLVAAYQGSSTEQMRHPKSNWSLSSAFMELPFLAALQKYRINRMFERPV